MSNLASVAAKQHLPLSSPSFPTSPTTTTTTTTPASFRPPPILQSSLRPSPSFSSSFPSSSMRPSPSFSSTFPSPSSSSSSKGKARSFLPNSSSVPDIRTPLLRSYGLLRRFGMTDVEESSDITSQLESSVSVGAHAFSHMEEDVDKQRLLGGQPAYATADPETASMTSDLQHKQRYERLLRRAKNEDLREVSGIGCLYQCGLDKFGRPVIIFVGKWFKFNEINLDKALLYLISLLDPLVKGDYVVIYFHTITTTENHPSLSWIRHVYDMLEYKYKKHLKAFYIVHPTLWTKIMTWWFTTFMAPQIKHKVHSVPGVEYLYDIIDPEQLEIPAYITEHDMTINGIRYYRPINSST